MSADEIATIMSEGDPTGSVTSLVDFALERGAPDNVTVVIADVIDGDGAGEDNVIPVVVGAAGEPRVRVRLPNVAFPDDAQPDPDKADGGGHGHHRLKRDTAEIEPLSSRSPHRPRRRWKVLSALALIVAGAAIIGLIAQNWLNSRWYVAVNGSPGTGTVAIYNGIQGSLLGIDLSKLSSDSALTVGSLPFFDQELVSKGIPASDEIDAQRIVSELTDRATACAEPLAPPGCPGVSP